MGPRSYSTDVLDVSLNTKFVRIVHIVYAAKMFTFITQQYSILWICHITYLSNSMK